MTKKERALYITPFLKDNPGILNKVKQQTKILSNNDIETVLEMNMKHKYVRVLPFVDRQFDYKITEKIKLFDVIYIRKPQYFTFNFLHYLKRIRTLNSDIKIILEIPTYPYDHEFKHRVLLGFKIIVDKIVQNYLQKYIDVVVTFSGESKIFNVPTIPIQNGYKFDISNLNYVKKNNGKIVLTIVANIEKWHGIDRLLTGLVNFPNRELFKLNIVGSGNKTVLNNLKLFTKQNGLEEFVCFLGEKKGKELKKILMETDIGVDSLGRHRSGVFYNSSLKGKEYLAFGLPVVSGVKTELDTVIKLQKYYFRVSADDSPINFSEIRKFYSRVYNNNNRAAIKNDIFDIGKENFDYDKTLKPLVSFIKDKDV
ncbi:glycosyltransferase [Liquorilactobacillus mali]|uniref:glycosyltransferase n=1 Tax=Liquorilactobacillus mali TaxID=1618 RepID=UPI002350C51F|nr:glycosyltransferase [Liquorilactobacillus mali]MDC7953519.1 glycosyltransferase [Liquorilactobacillus mali]